MLTIITGIVQWMRVAAVSVLVYPVVSTTMVPYLSVVIKVPGIVDFSLGSHHRNILGYVPSDTLTTVGSREYKYYVFRR